MVIVPTAADLTTPLLATEPGTPDSDTTWALGRFADPKRYHSYSESRAYYDGNHRLAFATESFREAFGGLFAAFAENMCPAVVDAVGDRLELIGFESSTKTTKCRTFSS